MLWEQLVTDGHVRAARLRAVQPVLLWVAIVLCVIGGFGALVVDGPVVREFERQGERGQLADRRRVETACFNLPDIDLEQGEALKLAPAFEIERVVQLIVDGLNDDGRVPEVLPVLKVDRQGFWDFGWPVDRLGSFRKGNVILVGAVVADERQVSATRKARSPVRWIGVFRQSGGKWNGVSLRFSGAFVPAGRGQAIDPADFPVTFRHLVPAFESGRAGG